MKDLYIGFIFLTLAFILVMNTWLFITSIINQDRIGAYWSSFVIAMFLTLWAYTEVKSNEEK